jgi:hypothetical protein
MVLLPHYIITLSLKIPLNPPFPKGEKTKEVSPFIKGGESRRRVLF